MESGAGAATKSTIETSVLDVLSWRRLEFIQRAINDQPADTAVNVVDEETVDAEQPTADAPDDVQGDSRVEEAEANDDEEDDED